MTEMEPAQSSIGTEEGFSSELKHKRRTKLKYLKYSPPSSAGADPGLWRQSLGQSTPGTAGRRYSPDDNDLEIISLSVDIANVSLDFKDPSVGGSARVNFNSSNQNSNHKRRVKRQTGGGRRLGMAPGRPVIKTGRPADPLVFNGKWTRRSTSNRLLNCFTIDDCMSRYRTQLALGHGGPEAWATAKAELAYTLDSFPNPRTSMGMRSATSEGRRTRKSHTEASGAVSRGSVTSPTREETFEETLLEDDRSEICNNDNEALSKAMHTIMTSREVVNNHALTGLFRKPKRHRREGQPRPEPTRFRKMNDTLHKWIDEEVILPRSRLGSMNSLRTKSLDENAMGGSAASKPSGPHSAGYRGPRSMDAPADAVRRRPGDVRFGGETRSRSAGDGASAQNHKGPYRSDSFLEMLMEMDEDKRPTGGDGQIPSSADMDTHGSAQIQA